MDTYAVLTARAPGAVLDSGLSTLSYICSKLVYYRMRDEVLGFFTQGEELDLKSLAKV